MVKSCCSAYTGGAGRLEATLRQGNQRSMSKSGEEHDLKKLVAKSALQKAQLRKLLAQPGLWATVFANTFRPYEEGSEADDTEYQDAQREEYFGNATAPEGLSDQPVFTFLFPKNWSWHVHFHGSARGGYSHLISKDGTYEGVAQHDGHPEVWSGLSVVQLKELSTLVQKSGPTEEKFLMPLLYSATVPAREEQRAMLEAWAAKQVEAAGILSSGTPQAFAAALFLTSYAPQSPKATPRFRQFLGDLGIG